MHFMCLKWSSLTLISTCFQDFGENFVDTTKETNRPEIFQFKSTSFLGNKSNKSNKWYFFQTYLWHGCNEKKIVSSLHTSTLLEESNDETFCAWCFVSIHRVKLMKNFFLCRTFFQLSGLIPLAYQKELHPPSDTKGRRLFEIPSEFNELLTAVLLK